MQAPDASLSLPSSDQNLHGLPQSYPHGIHKLHSVHILQRIFHHLLPAGPEVHDFFGWDWTYLASVRSVCRGWNAAALAEPSLWTYVFPLNFNKTLYSHYLALSQDLPLHVFLDFESFGEFPSHASATFTRESARIESMTVMLSTDCPEDDLEQLEQMFGNCHMTLLRKFQLAPRYNPDPDTMVEDEHVVAPILPRIFGHCPSLHTLELCDISSTPRGLFHGVRVFKLWTAHWQVADTGVSDVLDLLQENSLVTDLRLEGAFKLGTGYSKPFRQPLLLPVLRTLLIDDYSPAIMTLLSHLMIPPNARITIGCGVSAEELLDTFNALAQIGPACRSSSIPTLLQVTKLNISVDESGWPSWIGLDCSNRVLFELNMHLFDFQEGTSQSCDFVALSLAHIGQFVSQFAQEVAIDISAESNYSFDVNVWAAFFHSFPALRTLNITNQLHQQLVYALSATNNTLCTQLHTIRLRCSDIPNPCLKALHDVLQSRSLAGYGLQELAVVAPMGNDIAIPSGASDSPAFKAFAGVMMQFVTSVKIVSPVRSEEDEYSDKLWWAPPVAPRMFLS